MPSSSAQRRIKILVSIALVGGLVYFLDTESIAASLREIRPGYLLPAFAMVFLNRVLMPVKWNLLLRARGIRITHYAAVRYYTIASFLGLVLPPTVGADGVRTWYLRRAGIRLSDTVASIFIERAFGFVVLIVFAGAGLAMLLHMLRDGDAATASYAPVLAAIALAALLALFASFTPLSQHLASWIAQKLEGTRLAKLARGADSFVRAYQEYGQQKAVLALFSLLTALELTLVIVRSYVIALSLGADVSLTVFFAFLPLVLLLNRMPISFDGFGINEALFVYFLAQFGVPAEKGFLIGLINHLIFIVGILPGGIFYVMSDRESDPRRPEEETS